MKLGIYAGSFNPIHNVHLDIANKLIDEKIVDEVIFVPAGDGYNKPNLAKGTHRYEMIRNAIKGNSKLSVSDIEVLNNKLYSYQTLDYFKEKFGDCELYFIMGSDNLSQFHTWKRWEYILANYKLIVFLRNNQNFEEFVMYKDNKNIVFVEYNIKLSSSEIRANFKNKEEDEVRKKIHKDVYSYIKEFKLYE